jgi:hypothetical protein
MTLKIGTIANHSKNKNANFFALKLGTTITGYFYFIQLKKYS